MSPLSVEVEFTDDVAIFKTNGYINGMGGEKIETQCRDVLREGYRKFIINFDDAPIVNSIGVSILIGLIDRIKKAKGAVFFTNVTMTNSEIFDFMGLTEFAPIFRSQEDAFRTMLASPCNMGSQS